MLFFTLFILVLCSFLEIQQKKSYSLFFFIIMGLLVFDFIKAGSGTDYFFYFNDYHNYSEISNYKSRYELLYSGISKLASLANLPYHLFLLGFYSCYYFLIGFTIKKHSPYPILSIFLFFCITIGILGSLRQLISMAIIFFATFSFIEIKKNYNYLYFLLLLIIATGFHYSAILALPIILFNKNISDRVWFVILVISALLLIFRMNDFMVINADDYLPEIYSSLIKKYSNASNITIPLTYHVLFGVIRRGILVVVFLVYKEKFQHLRFFRILYNISWFSLIFYLFFYTIPFIGSRAGHYFLIFESISYAIIIKSVYRQKLRSAIMYLILIFGLFLCIKNISIYPDLFIPYKTIFGAF